jgi:hypothetical protein
LTVFTVALSYATATDNFSSTTAISSTTFTPTSTPTLFTAQFSVPSAATTGLKLQFSGGQAGTTGTIQFGLGSVQLEVGTVATSFDFRSIGTELIMCQRYFQLLQFSYGTSLGTTVIARCTWPLRVTMRASMTIAVVGSPNWFFGGGTATYASIGTNYSIPEMAQVDMSVTGGASASGTMCSSASGGSAYFTASAEL